MQNLNLYQTERKRRGGGPERGQLLAGLALLVLACALHGAWLAWQLHQGGERLAGVEAEAQAQQNLLVAAQASFVEPQLDPSLPLQLSAREAESRQLQRLLGYLEILARQRAVGFVGPLQALAEQHPQTGLWLHAIQLDAGGTELRLQGRSQSQELLPEYLQRLGRSPVFKGREFARFEVGRGEDQLLHFDLSSRSKDPETADE